MLAVPAAAAAKIPHLPESPGVYLWKDAEGRVLYIGKAKRPIRVFYSPDEALAWLDSDPRLDEPA